MMPLSDQDFLTWRDYQRRLSKKARRRYYLKRLPWLGLWSGAGALMLVILFYSVSWLSAYFEDKTWHPPRAVPREPTKLTKKDLAPILDRLDADRLTDSHVLKVESNEGPLTIETSIHPELQRYLMARSSPPASPDRFLRSRSARWRYRRSPRNWRSHRRCPFSWSAPPPSEGWCPCSFET